MCKIFLLSSSIVIILNIFYLSRSSYQGYRRIILKNCEIGSLGRGREVSEEGEAGLRRADVKCGLGRGGNALRFSLHAPLNTDRAILIEMCYIIFIGW